MLHDRIVRYCRLAITLLLLVLVWMALWQALWPAAALAQGTSPASSALPATTSTLQPSPLTSPLTTALPSVWYLFAAGLALFVPAGFVLLAVANLEPQNSWNTALGGLAAAGLAAFAVLGRGLRASVRRHRACLPARRVARSGLGVEPVVERVGHWLGHGRPHGLVPLRFHSHSAGLHPLHGPSALGAARGDPAGDGAARQARPPR